MKKSLILVLTVCTFYMKSQLALSYFPFQSIIALSSNTEKLMWADYKVETNTFIANMNMELSPKINIKRTDVANYYVGIGVRVNFAYAAVDLPFSGGYFFDIGTRIKPFKNYRSVQLVFELSPYVTTAFNAGNLRTRLGVAYNFQRKKKETKQ